MQIKAYQSRCVHINEKIKQKCYIFARAISEAIRLIDLCLYTHIINIREMAMLASMVFFATARKNSRMYYLGHLACIFLDFT